MCQTADFNPDRESASCKTILAWYWYILATHRLHHWHIHLVSQNKFNRVTKINISAYSFGIQSFLGHTCYVSHGLKIIYIMLILFTHAIGHFYYMLHSLWAVMSDCIFGESSTWQPSKMPRDHIHLLSTALYSDYTVERKCIIRRCIIGFIFLLDTTVLI